MTAVRCTAVIEFEKSYEVSHDYYERLTLEPKASLMRLALGAPVWRRDWEAGEARMAFWYRYRVPQHDARGGLDPLAIPPIADTMPSSLARRLGPEHPRFFAPSLDLTVHFLDPGQTDWYLVDVRCPRARQGYATAHADVWDAEGRLVAFAWKGRVVDIRVQYGQRRLVPSRRRRSARFYVCASHLVSDPSWPKGGL